MGLPFVTLAAHAGGDIFRLSQEYIIGRMRGMTAHAIAGFNGLTQAFIFRILYRPFLQFHRVGMTGAANLELGVIQKLFFPGAVGMMAVQTADFACQGGVHSIFVKGFRDHHLMAIPA